jgi:anaerobic ribonucleoside-triphosphate reductase activating protein
MYYDKIDVVFQEVPNEISLTIRFTGCPLQCKGCHSENSKSAQGTYLSMDKFIELLNKHESRVSCVLFMGGEWYADLHKYIQVANEMNFKTCLYTGLNNVHPKLVEQLTYLKTGPWIESRGGLDNENTNQVFTNLQTGEILNHLFRR